MRAICRLGDSCTGHGGFPPRPNITSCQSVFANNIRVHRVGDAWAVHCSKKKCHPGVTASGSNSVFVEGKQVARIGDPLNCGSRIASGSRDVFVG